jgi:hypothetical protein
MTERSHDRYAPARAVAINEFLYLLSLGNSPRAAFERAVEGSTTISLTVPSNLRMEVMPNDTKR